MLENCTLICASYNDNISKLRVNCCPLIYFRFIATNSSAYYLHFCVRLMANIRFCEILRTSEKLFPGMLHKSKAFWLQCQECCLYFEPPNLLINHEQCNMYLKQHVVNFFKGKNCLKYQKTVSCNILRW